MTGRPDEVLFTVSVLGAVDPSRVRVERVRDSEEVDVWIGPARLRLDSWETAEAIGQALMYRAADLEERVLVPHSPAPGSVSFRNDGGVLKAVAFGAAAL